jgi:hypothetical protein
MALSHSDMTTGSLIIIFTLFSSSFIIWYMRRIWEHKNSFLCLAHVTLLTPAQGRLSRLSLYSGLLTFAQLKYHFRHTTPQYVKKGSGCQTLLFILSWTAMLELHPSESTWFRCRGRLGSCVTSSPTKPL